MKHTGYNKRRERGRLNFPIEYHLVTSRHPRYTMPYHWHVEYEIIRLIRGNIHFTLNEKTFWASAGDILFVVDGIVHAVLPKAIIAFMNAPSLNYVQQMIFSAKKFRKFSTMKLSSLTIFHKRIPKPKRSFPCF